MNTKAWYKSKTLWFNVLAILGLVATQFGYGEFKLDQDTIDIVLKILAGVTAAGNVGLRLVTKEPIGKG